MKEPSTEKHVLHNKIDTWTQIQEVKVRMLVVRTALLPRKRGGYRKKHSGLFWNTEKLLDLTVGIGYPGSMCVKPLL